MGPEVLQDVTFRIDRGAFRYIKGPSGAGKSSLLRLLSLGRLPSRGELRLFGTDVRQIRRAELPALRRKIGVVFQDFRLIPHLTAIENVLLPLHLARIESHRSEAHVRELLEWVGLGKRMEAKPSTLSGGEQQRVAIARAVILSPEILVADEPTGSVDDAIGRRLVHLFEQMNAIGTTVIVATHNEELIRRTPHEVLELDRGRVNDPGARPAGLDGPAGEDA
ncbi:MAG: ATP-binding cassette domain-containing protein [Rhodospirillaceae bacterium]|nr:ATP-binding cassette domain-containing protein [Rhodospirillaceae bacterium]